LGEKWGWGGGVRRKNGDFWVPELIFGLKMRVLGVESGHVVK